MRTALMPMEEIHKIFDSWRDLLAFRATTSRYLQQICDKPLEVPHSVTEVHSLVYLSNDRRVGVNTRPHSGSQNIGVALAENSNDFLAIADSKLKRKIFQGLGML